MKVIVDILTPKQCMFFAKLSQRLRDIGYQVFHTTREYREVNQLLEMKGIEAHVVGKHGGAKLEDKLVSSTQRTLELASIVARERPNKVVSFASPEISRVAFGLRIPHVSVNDSPHSEAVARLTVPLVTSLLTPKLIPKAAWTRFGIQRKQIIQYNAIDPWAWLKDFEPDRKILKQLALVASKPIVLFRPEESLASYLLDKTLEPSGWTQLLKSLLKSGVEFQAVVIPRYDEQITQLTQKFGKNAIICKSTIDAPSLLAYCSIFVGAGGTMTAEAALLGVPTFSCYPSNPSLVEKYLISKGLIVRESNTEKVKVKILRTLSNIEAVKKRQYDRAHRLTSSFEDPIQVITEAVEKVS